MKKVILIMIFLFLVHGFASAGTLYGRIKRSNRRSLANTTIIFRGDTATTANTTIIFRGGTVRTNVFGRYSIYIPDGRYDQLTVVIGNRTYISDPIRIYSPRTKQNWRMYRERLIRIR